MAKDKDRRKESKGKQPAGGQKKSGSPAGYQDRQMDTAHKGGKSGGSDKRDRR